jgi:hypothetical protein
MEENTNRKSLTLRIRLSKSQMADVSAVARFYQVTRSEAVREAIRVAAVACRAAGPDPERAKPGHWDGKA